VYLGFDVARQVMLGSVQHQVLESFCEAHHQRARWRRAITVGHVFLYDICTLFAFGFFAEGLHHCRSCVAKAFV
jgi:hypothetical protein